ncbi:hypothetical protein ACIQVK_25205 [Streptomyces sp. NPDC090493]|uniref:hypothetical protein n=1 Tax=Streptomyces sp. NPDC090493 TaxID=3365964 RepID=UPI003830869D
MTECVRPEELQRWHSLVLMDAPARISLEASAGVRCVWCDASTREAGVDLGLGHIPLRCCLTCYMGRLAWMATWWDWHDHIAACAACLRGATCYVARGRRALHAATIARGGSGPMCCHLCHGQVADHEAAVAVAWSGQSGVRLSYAHIVPCLVREAAR